MFSETKYEGDAGYIGDDLFAGDRELESRCFAITKGVREGYFSLGEALLMYEVSELHYAAYLLLHKQHLQMLDANQQFTESLKIVIETFRSVVSKLDPRKREIIQELEMLS